MRNFIILVNILALILPFLAAKGQNPDPACHKKDEILYDQKRVLPTPVGYVLNSNFHYEPNYYHHTPSVAITPYVHYLFIIKLLLLRSPPQISQWQLRPNFPQPTEVPQAIPSPSFLAIPKNENKDSTATPTINTDAPAESTTVLITEQVTTAVANPEASTVSINNPEASTVSINNPEASTVFINNPEVPTVFINNLEASTVPINDPGASTVSSNNPETSMVSINNSETAAVPISSHAT
ncbi:kappa-casein [Phodopus roborovskii]|uniref:Kappa-casein n=1 Tax=Phodopus roborovskii TaxID=109678 RepID=A0AAU9ZTU1_PHORO|nr:kappa-casein [Phodopus roborovskii]CAH6886254.1 Csn3 [Phodopus roborovskii]